MTNQKKASWVGQIGAVFGVVLWIGITLYFRFYLLTTIITLIAVPATIYNVVREARSTEPIC